VKQELVITDVTRMQAGRVCIAGYDRKRNCVRPVLPPPGIHETLLSADGKPRIFPFAVVEFDLQEHIPKPPHVEDWRFDPAAVRFVKRLGDAEKKITLERLCFADVQSIYETHIFTGNGSYLLEGEGRRSLGTIQPTRISQVNYEKQNDAWKYRLQFEDRRGKTYHLTITDLAWRYFCDARRNAGETPEQISATLCAELRARPTFLRIGLARGWDKYPGRCYLQITGVYTVPDFLNGRTFADFALA